jgi:hypothetical protein
MSYAFAKPRIPTATSRIAFAPGTRNVIIYTVSNPTGLGRFVLTRCLVRVGLALGGTGNITFSIGSTAGGTQIILPTVINAATPESVVAGEAIASLSPTGMPATNGYEAVFDFGQNIWANLTAVGVVSAGYADVYLYGLLLSS